MDKEQLKIKLEALEANEAIKREELGVAISSAQVAREELANVNKPKISEDQANTIVSNLCKAFHDKLGEYDSGDLGIEFSLDYNNTVVVDDISGLDDLDAPEDEYREILNEVFNITFEEDEE